MTCILEYINTHSSKMLAKMFYQHCDKRMILFINEIVLNLLDGVIPVDNTNKKQFLKFRLQLEPLYKLGKQRKRGDVNATLTRQRAVLCSHKGLKLVKILFNLIRNRQFTR